MRPVISFIAATYRDWMYKECCDSFVSNSKVPVEFIFVGPNPPTETMPENFTHILSNVKPTQCLEIAARKAIGDYLIVGSDDERFYGNFLDRLYNYIQRMDMGRVFITFRYSVFRKPRDFQLAVHRKIPTSTLLGVSGCFRRDLWNRLGGMDRRWVGSYGDVDMQMRFYEYGMNPFLPPDCIIDEVPIDRKRDKKRRLYDRTGKGSRRLFLKLWTDRVGNPLPKRLWAVEPFDDENILTETQGEELEWGNPTARDGSRRYI